MQHNICDSHIDDPVSLYLTDPGLDMRRPDLKPVCSTFVYQINSILALSACRSEIPDI
jgi:hypothetical protein